MTNQPRKVYSDELRRLGFSEAEIQAAENLHNLGLLGYPWQDHEALVERTLEACKDKLPKPKRGFLRRLFSLKWL